MKNATSFLLVLLGGGTGALLRFLVSGWLKNPVNGFPAGTFGVNMMGCFFIGFLYNISFMQNQQFKLLLITGLLGGFTTFSTFGMETFYLLKNARFQAAFFYLFLSNICGLLAVYTGIKLSSSL